MKAGQLREALTLTLSPKAGRGDDSALAASAIVI